MGKRILIVDDEPDILKSVVFRLNKAGYDTIMAEDGEEGLSKVLSELPDLVVLDWKLPKMNGGEIYRKMKEDDSCKPIPVIFLTASSESKQISLGLEGIDEDHVMLKPYEPSELIGKVKKLIG